MCLSSAVVFGSRFSGYNAAVPRLNPTRAFDLRVADSDDDRRQVWITVEPETDTVRIAGPGPFTRLSGPLL